MREWSVKKADVGTAVDLKVETLGVADGEKATLEIYVRDGNYSDHRLEVIEAQVSGDKIKESWTMQVDEKYLNICGGQGGIRRDIRRLISFIKYRWEN